MLKTLSLSNFRQFHQLDIPALNRINLIAGRNNTGKTALLEALLLLFGDQNVISKLPSIFRSAVENPVDDFYNFWMWLFSQADINKNPYVIIKDLDCGTLKLIIDGRPLLDPNTPFIVLTHTQSDVKGDLRGASQHIFKNGPNQAFNQAWRSLLPHVSYFSLGLVPLSNDAEIFNKVALKKGGKQKLVKLLQVIEPRLQDLQYLKPAQVPSVYADVGYDQLISISQMGQGFLRLFRIFAEAYLADSKIILIDEIENGIGYRALVNMWQGLAAAARSDDLQIFATTHSHECIQAAHEVFSRTDHYDFAYHRLDRLANDEIVAVTYDQADLVTSFEMNLEVR